MTCTGNDYVFAAALLIFTLAASFSTWHLSSLLKILELRHVGIFNMLGRPDPLRKIGSDRHAIALLRFVCSDDHQSLADEEINQIVGVLRYSFFINLLAVSALFGCLLWSPSPKELVMLGCWVS